MKRFVFVLVGIWCYAGTYCYADTPDQAYRNAYLFLTSLSAATPDSPSLTAIFDEVNEVIEIELIEISQDEASERHIWASYNREHDRIGLTPSEISDLNNLIVLNPDLDWYDWHDLQRRTDATSSNMLNLLALETLIHEYTHAFTELLLRRTMAIRPPEIRAAREIIQTGVLVNGEPITCPYIVMHEMLSHYVAARIYNYIGTANDLHYAKATMLKDIRLQETFLNEMGEDGSQHRAALEELFRLENQRVYTAGRWGNTSAGALNALES